MEKICTGCKALKSIDEFGNDKKAFDGKNQKCKQCCNERAKKTIRSAESIEKSKIYKSEWQKKKRPILNARLREYYINNLEKMREQGRERQQRYMKTEKGKSTHLNASRRWKEENKEKFNAHQKVKIALKNGKLFRPEKCEICKKEGKIEAHHEDYSKPLEVIWMCQYCHLYHHQSSRFHAERLNELAPIGDAIVRSEEETFRDTQK